ncbi:hypothetical protein [Pedobacter ginsengisoli]|uniref:hypothetical protein n=1 Tax=Pedobacter ginsengisoli TaxID=363852 RepID=UPI00254CBB6A|nr:hypothetical protein [Pedobacter ginsengisoli]
MNENLLRDILRDEELKAKYELSEDAINKAQLAPPYAHPIIEYLATIIRASILQNHSDATTYNQLKNIMKIS